VEKNIPIIKKSEIPYGELQQFVLEKISEFTCLRCKKNKVSKRVAIHKNDWSKQICNGCYGFLLSKYSEQNINETAINS
jgi:hypothetical protein